MKRMAEVSNISIITKELEDEKEKVDPNSIDKRIVPKGVEVFEINRPFFFGAATKFKEQLKIVENPPKILIIRMRNLTATNAIGLQILRELYNDSKKNRTHIILSGVHTQPLYTMTQAGIYDLYGEKNIHGNIDDALDRAREILRLPKIGRPRDFVPTVKRDIESEK